MDIPTIFIVSGGSGASADQLVQTALAQFPDNPVSVKIFSNIREFDQVDELLRLAKPQNAVIVHTLVDYRIYEYLIK